jgi:hypothetical protein
MTFFEARRFLTQHVGTAHDVPRLFSRYGLPGPLQGAAEKWYERDSISGLWLPRLLCLLELEQGAPVSLAPYTNFGSRSDG